MKKFSFKFVLSIAILTILCLVFYSIQLTEDTSATIEEKNITNKILNMQNSDGGFRNTLIVDTYSQLYNTSNALSVLSNLDYNLNNLIPTKNWIKNLSLDELLIDMNSTYIIPSIEHYTFLKYIFGYSLPQDEIDYIIELLQQYQVGEGYFVLDLANSNSYFHADNLAATNSVFQIFDRLDIRPDYLLNAVTYNDLTLRSELNKKYLNDYELEVLNVLLKIQSYSNFSNKDEPIIHLLDDSLSLLLSKSPVFLEILAISYPHLSTEQQQVVLTQLPQNLKLFYIEDYGFSFSSDIQYFDIASTKAALNCYHLLGIPVAEDMKKDIITWFENCIVHEGYIDFSHQKSTFLATYFAYEALELLNYFDVNSKKEIFEFCLSNMEKINLDYSANSFVENIFMLKLCLHLGIDIDESKLIDLFGYLEKILDGINAEGKVMYYNFFITCANKYNIPISHSLKEQIYSHLVSTNILYSTLEENQLNQIYKLSLLSELGFDNDQEYKESLSNLKVLLAQKTNINHEVLYELYIYCNNNNIDITSFLTNDHYEILHENNLIFYDDNSTVISIKDILNKLIIKSNLTM